MTKPTIVRAPFGAPFAHPGSGFAYQGYGGIVVPTPEWLYLPESRSDPEDPLINTGTLGTDWNVEKYGSATYPMPSVEIEGRWGIEQPHATSTYYRFLQNNPGELQGYWAAGDGLTALGWYRCDSVDPTDNVSLLPLYANGGDYLIGLTTPGANTLRVTMTNAAGAPVYPTSDSYLMEPGWYFCMARWNAQTLLLEGALWKDGVQVAYTAGSISDRWVGLTASYDIFALQYSSGNDPGTYLGASGIWMKRCLSDAEVQAVRVGGQILG